MKLARISLWLTDAVLIALMGWVFSWSGTPGPEMRPDEPDPRMPAPAPWPRAPWKNLLGPPEEQRPDLLELLGTNVCGPGWSFAFFRVGECHVAAFLGDAVDGAWRLAAVGARSATLSNGAETRVIEMK